MANKGRNKAKAGAGAGVMLGAAVALLALPSAVLAFTAKFEAGAPLSESSGPIEQLQAPPGSSAFARAVAIRSLAKDKLYPFTPADTPNRPDRSVTVAVRVDAQAAQAMARGKAASDDTKLRIAPTAFTLGVSRGYKNFTQDLVPPASKPVGEIPDLGQFSIANGGKEADSRFSPRIVIDETQGAGRAPRTFAGDNDDRVDVGGSYRVTRNLDVTAGVRYSQERERLAAPRAAPLTDGKQDSQAVYVGTQFRF